MGATIQDIADKLNISNSTVSRALNNKGQDYISAATRQRIIDTARQMGYRRNHVGRMLASGRTNLIAYWSSRICAPHTVMLAYELQRNVRANGYELITAEHGKQTVFDEDYPVRLAVDGIVSAGLILPHIDNSISGGVPIVGVGHGSFGCRDMDYVDVNLYDASCEAMRYLCRRGPRVALMQWIKTHAGDQRLRAYLGTLDDTGGEPEFIYVKDGKRSTARETIKAYVDAHGCPDALFCANDDIAIGVCKGLRERGYSIPEDVEIAGCDGIEDIQYLDVPVSTIIQPVEEIGSLAWRLLKRRIEDRSLPQQTAVLDAEFVPRQT